MKNLGQLMKQAQEMQAKMGEMQERLAEMTVEGSSAAGMVTVTLSGKGEMKGIRIDPSLVNPAEAGGLYRVRSGRFSGREEAARHAVRLSEAGFESIVVPGEP